MRRQSLVCALAIAFACLRPEARVLPQSAPPAEAFDTTSFQSGKGYFSQLPFERIDMINGGLTLSFTDLVLPGNAGMDLRIVRTYTRQDLKRWEFGFAGVPLRVMFPNGNGVQSFALRLWQYDHRRPVGI